MTFRLYAGRYANSLTSPALLEFFERPANLGIRWSLPGGVQRIELTIPSRNKADTYDRYLNHHGQRIAILDQWLDRPVAEGRVYEIVPDGRHIHYIIGGAWKQHGDDPYLVTDFPGTGNTDAIIKDALTDRVPIANSDQNNIASTSTAIGAWTPAETVGTPVTEIIEELSVMSDSSYNIYDYWLRSAPLTTGITLQKPIPYFAARSTSANADWIVYLKDIAGGGLTFARHIWDLKRSVKVAYGRISGVHDTNANSASLIDNGVNFVTAGVNIGDTVTNTTDGCTGRVTGFANGGGGTNDEITFTSLTGGTDNDFDVSDRYSIKLQKLLLTAAATSTETDLWVTTLIVRQPDMDATQAAQFRNRLLTEYERAVQQQAFTVTAPRIQAGSGGKYPLWMPIKNGGGYVRGHGLHQWAGLFALSLDRLQAFRIVAMDYDYRGNQLRIVPDTFDSRLDVIMKRAGIAAGEIVSRRDMPLRTPYSYPGGSK